jgi:hypothetical protein
MILGDIGTIAQAGSEELYRWATDCAHRSISSRRSRQGRAPGSALLRGLASRRPPTPRS